MGKNDAQQGPSGSQDNKKAMKAKKRAEKEEKKRIKSIWKTEQQQKRRNSSQDSTLRYKIPARPDRYQRSHTVSKLIPKPDQSVEANRPKSRNVTKSEIEESHSRDHHDAAEFYNKTLPYAPRGSFFNLMKVCSPSKLDRFHKHEVSAVSKQKIHHHVKRCKKCLYKKDDCICQKYPVVPPKSDWATMVQSPAEEQVTFNSRRIEWLEQLEKNSVVDRRQLIEEKFNNSFEICCFPFNTFRLFSKRDIEMTDFYIKH